MLGDGLGHAVDHPLQVVVLLRLLYLHENDLAVAVLRLDVHTVELVVLVLLVAFALQQLHDFHPLLKQHREEPLEHAEVGLVAQDVFCSPVEPDVMGVIFFHFVVSVFVHFFFVHFVNF